MINKLLNIYKINLNNNKNNTPQQLHVSKNKTSNNNQPTTKYHSLIYIKNSSDKIKKLFSKYNNIKIAHTKSTTLKSKLFTKLKDTTPYYKQSNIIYKIPCKDCNKTYTGVSSQTFKARIQQHIHDSTHKPSSTALSEHLHTNKHIIDMDNCKILHTEKHYNKRLTLEMIYIKTDPHSMNKKQDTNQLNNIYSNIITQSLKL